MVVLLPAPDTGRGRAGLYSCRARSRGDPSVLNPAETYSSGRLDTPSGFPAGGFATVSIRRRALRILHPVRALVAQWTEHAPPKRGMQVRLLPGASRSRS